MRTLIIIDNNQNIYGLYIPTETFLKYRDYIEKKDPKDYEIKVHDTEDRNKYFILNSLQDPNNVFVETPWYLQKAKNNDTHFYYNSRGVFHKYKVFINELNKASCDGVFFYTIEGKL